jgi:hypothetical protein
LKKAIRAFLNTLALKSHCNNMKNFETKFNALTPEEEEKKPQTPEEEKLETPAEKREYIEEKENSVSYLGVEVPKGEGGPLVPDKQESANYFYTEEDYILRREIATSLALNKPLLFEGGTGIGKTTAVASMCAQLEMNYCKVDFGRDMAVQDVIGDKTMAIEDGKEVFKWYDGNLMLAVRHGGIALLDEYNRQGSKIGSRVNPIIDAILNGRKTISLPENDNEEVEVHPNFRIVAAQNPPGTEEGQEFTGREVLSAETFGRYTFHKLPLNMSKEMRNKRMAGMMGEEVDIDIPKQEFKYLGEGIPLKELKDIPGMTHWRREAIEVIDMLTAKSTGAKREMARDQRQKLYFNPRLEQGLLNYVGKFYRGDVNEVWKDAFEHLVVGMYKSEEDKQKVREALNQASFLPQTESKRKGAERDIEEEKGKERQEMPKSKLEGAIAEQIETAMEIMGTKEVFGPEDLKNIWGIELSPEEIPEIPFSKEDFERAKELGQYLVLRADKTPDGKPLTILAMNELQEEKFKDAGGGKILYSKDDEWKMESDFYTKEAPEISWSLTSKEVIPDSTSKNYLKQTEIIANYLRNEVFKGTVTFGEYQKAIGEFNKKKEKIEKLMDSDWQKAAEELENLKITQLTRQTPSEVLFDGISYFLKNKEKLLESKYTWTRRRHSDGKLVRVGLADGGGASVDGIAPGSRIGTLGVSFSRRV